MVVTVLNVKDGRRAGEEVEEVEGEEGVVEVYIFLTLICHRPNSFPAWAVSCLLVDLK